MPQTQTIDLGYEVKELQEDGTFQGYASVFGVEDFYGDIVDPGAFRASLSGWRKKKRAPAMLWAHKTDEPIGVWTSMEEDDHGLVTEGRLALKTQRGAEAYELLKLRAITGLSIGYEARKSKLDSVTGKRVLQVIDLWETSLVAFPANDEARIGAVRSAMRDGRMPTPREIEQALRDAGLSLKHAKAIVAKGVGALGLRDEDDDAVNVAALETLLIFRGKQG